MSWLRDIDSWLIDEVMPHADSYRALARKLVGPADAEDVVQDAYARLLGVSAWREIASPRAFTLQVIRNLALERLRRASLVRMDQLTSLDRHDVSDPSPDAFAVVADRAELKRVLALIEALPPQCRKVMKMRKMDGKSPGQIAESLGLSVSTVEKHLAKGLALVAAGLAERPGGQDRRFWRELWPSRRKKHP